MSGPGDGITFLDHTADVGIDVAAPSLEALFHRAALGTLALLRGHDDDEPAAEAGAPTDTRRVALDAQDLEGLLVAWLKEVLFLHEVHGADYVSATFDRVGDRALTARVRTGPAARAVREIKGVTYHALAVDRTDAGWTARVIFDV